MFNSYTPPTRSSDKLWKYVAFASAGFLIVAALAYFIATPFLTVWDMRRAAESRDGTRFAGYIDFPKFKENLKAELNAAMAQKLANDKSLQDNPFSGLGMLMAPTIVNNM